MIVVMCAFATAGTALCLQLSREAKSDETAISTGATIRGTVTLLNHPTMGRTKGPNVFIAFQRTDCNRCVVGAKTDAGGAYSLFLATGRYKLIMRYGTRAGETSDFLAPNQIRFVDIGGAGEIKEFNIEVMFPKD
jgi:hypothetical protein